MNTGEKILKHLYKFRFSNQYHLIPNKITRRADYNDTVRNLIIKPNKVNLGNQGSLRITQDGIEEYKYVFSVNRWRKAFITSLIINILLLLSTIVLGIFQ